MTLRQEKRICEADLKQRYLTTKIMIIIKVWTSGLKMVTRERLV